MEEKRTSQLVWVTDRAGNRFLCPLDVLKDPDLVSEEEKKYCIDDAADINLHFEEGR